jgi:hypothetical protein
MRWGTRRIARAALVAVALAACATTTRLDRMVVAYDTTTAESISKLLLLNIARARHNMPMHFTGIANVVATYRFAFGGGIGPAATGDQGWLPVPNVQGSVEENPTISIAPMQGEEFTQRLLTPFPEQKLTLLLRQGYDVDALLRLLGSEIRIAREGDGAMVAYRNRPRDRRGYTMFRQVVAHLSTIQDRHALYVEPLHYEHTWTVPADSVTPESFATVYKDFTLTLDPVRGVYRVTSRINGRVVITNYDPNVLTNEERLVLHGEANEVPFNDVLIDIRPGHVGGELRIHGALRLRSFHEVLTFVGRSIEEEPEYAVAPDPRTPKVADNPVTTLEISETEGSPGGVSVGLRGRHYAVRQQRGYQWNNKAFSMLYQLFQMSVSSVEHTGPAITIAK